MTDAASPTTSGELKAVPVIAAEEIAKKYDYDQVIVIARKVGNHGGESVTTYGRNKEHCSVAARVGDFLKHKVMGWHQEDQAKPASPWKYPSRDGMPEEGDNVIIVWDSELSRQTLHRPWHRIHLTLSDCELVCWMPVPEVPASKEI